MLVPLVGTLVDMDLFVFVFFETEAFEETSPVVVVVVVVGCILYEVS
jgi:hypothetical protein